jgi:L-iditol 2-dehydrogenase
VRRKGLTIKVARRMKLTYPRAIALVHRRMIDVLPLVTHRFPLEQADDAFRLVEGYQDKVIKAVVYP